MSRSKHDWPTLVHAQARSGQSIEAFCRARGVSVSNFYMARSRMRKSSGLIPIHIDSPGGEETICIALQLGRSMIELRASAAAFASVLKAL